VLFYFIRLNSLPQHDLEHRLDTSPFVFCAINLLSAALIPPISYFKWGASDGFSGVKWAATALAIYAARSYLFEHYPTPTHPPSTMPSIIIRRRITVRLLYDLIKTKPIAITVWLLLLMALPLVFIIRPLLPRNSSKQFTWNSSAMMEPPPPHTLLNLQSPTKECVRKPLPPSSTYVGPGPRPDFHAFDEVLVIVFFSHPRYDVNLDGYREAYSRYFPNVSDRRRIKDSQWFSCPCRFYL